MGLVGGTILGCGAGSSITLASLALQSCDYLEFTNLRPGEIWIGGGVSGGLLGGTLGAATAVSDGMDPIFGTEQAHSNNA